MHRKPYREGYPPGKCSPDLKIYIHIINNTHCEKETLRLTSFTSFFQGPTNQNQAKLASENLGMAKLQQGVKLRLIKVPMRLNFSLWRPNPENKSPNWRLECFIITLPRDIVN